MNSKTASARAALAAGCVALSCSAGCASDTANRDLDLLFTYVGPLDYARILCSGIDMQHRHTCLTSVVGHYDEARARDPSPDNAVAGPFVVVLRNDLYRGNYVSQPFASAFSVSNGSNLCRGRYNAFSGDTDAVYRVTCDDGSRGRANVILDQDGANGIGLVEMDDGTRGDILFGHAAVGGASP